MTHLGWIWNDIKVEPKIILSRRHVVPDHLNRYTKSGLMITSSEGSLLRVGSFSGICVSGLTVLFCLLTNTHKRIWFSRKLKCWATRLLKVLYGSCFKTRKLGKSEGGQFFSSKDARSKPSCRAKVSSVMTYAE